MSNLNCIFCGKTYSRRDNLKRHLDTNSCNKIFTNYEIYSQFLENIKIIKKLNDTVNIKDEEITRCKEKINIQNKQIIEYNQDIHLLQNNIYIPHQLDAILHDTLIDLNKNCNGVYLAMINKNTVKFGKTSDLQSRISNHLKDFGRFELFYFVRNMDHGRLEMMLKNHVLLKNNLVTLVINNTKHNELFHVDDIVTIKYIKMILSKESHKLEVIQHYNIKKQVQLIEGM